MELTQRLDNSIVQEFHKEPEQIGFLGICGKRYPIRIGPNRIGRDPKMCHIILDLPSISRSHALINVINKHTPMLMDVGSANGTKMSGKTLLAFISYPLKNGTVVQFGDVFGDFRLLDDDLPITQAADLPMTQVIDVPDTPLPIKHGSRINAMTTVPESPDVSDKDDSFIVPSQPQGPGCISASTSNFIKPGRTISIQPVGSSKIDNIYWNSSKKSTSLNLDDSNASFNDSIPPVKIEIKEDKTVTNDIHELETQMFQVEETDINNANTEPQVHIVNTQMPNNSPDEPSIHSVNTQLPCGSSPSIHNENTQLPFESNPSIYNVNTQLPCGISPSIHNVHTEQPNDFKSPSVQRPGDNLPEVHKINEQQDMQFDLCPNNINNAETRLYPAGKENIPVNSRNNNDSPASMKSHKLDTSNEEVLFDEVDDIFEEKFESQTILAEDTDLLINKVEDIEPLSRIKPVSAKINLRTSSDDIELLPLSQIVMPKSAKRNMRIKSDDDSTDCDDDDMLLTQNVTKIVGDDATTDNMIEFHPKTDVQTAQNVDFEDMLTQVLEVDNIVEKDAVIENKKANADLDFEDMPTQVLVEDVPLKKQPMLIKTLTMTEEKSPFKIPLNSALKAKKKEGSRTPKIRPIPFITNTFSKKENNDKYYENTQDIYEDLCTQIIDPVQIKSDNKVSVNEEKPSDRLILDTSIINVDDEEDIEGMGKNMSNQEVLDVIGVDNNQVAYVKKISSDGSNASDVETTPKKQRPYKFMNIDLPDSQEISVSLSTRTDVTESSSESETENNSEEQCTPIVFRKKSKSKIDVKLDLTKKFDVETLPSRVITRVRKPTAKLHNEGNKNTNKMLKPKFMTEQECEIDKDIITENISRLKSKNDKVKNTKIHNSNNKSIKDDIIEVMNVADSGKKVRACRKKTGEVVLKTEANDKSKDSINDSKSNGRTTRDSRKAKKELSDSKNQSNCDKSTNSSSSIVGIISVESKDQTQAKKSKIETLGSTISSIETIRSTRSRNAKAKTRKKSPSPEKERKPKHTDKATKPKPHKEEQKEPTPEKEIRRSKRQRIAKEVKKEPPKSILKKSFAELEAPKSILKRSVTELSEESAVYNTSSITNDSSHGKRPFLDSDAPNAKRPRSGNNNNTLKAIPAATTTQRVLFTAFPFESVKYTLKNMGAEVVTDVLQCTVLLTKQIKRTFKLLCAVGLGKPIVGTAWVDACTDNNVIVDPWQYLIKDEAAEKRFVFSLERTLRGRRGFLGGYRVSSTPSVMPDAGEMKLIVECSGGTWQEGGERWVCVSVPGDRALWPELRRRGATVVSTEFILGGVLRQKVDIKSNMFK